MTCAQMTSLSHANQSCSPVALGPAGKCATRWFGRLRNGRGGPPPAAGSLARNGPAQVRRTVCATQGAGGPHRPETILSQPGRWCKHRHDLYDKPHISPHRPRSPPPATEPPPSPTSGAERPPVVPNATLGTFQPNETVLRVAFGTWGAAGQLGRLSGLARSTRPSAASRPQ